MSLVASVTTELIRVVRRLGADTADIEIKAAAGGLPKTVVESLSAFANGSGGTLILGLREDHSFSPATGFDALAIRDALAGVCADGLEPPLRLDIAIEELEGAVIVRADVPELDPLTKPCFVKARGAYQGSFIRGGDGDRRLTQFEVTQLLSNRSQPRDDTEAVAEATMEDLDPELVSGVVRRVRSRNTRAFAGLDDAGILIRLGAAVNEPVKPTLAGLLCLGSYPQQFFPQLFISFVALPGLTLGDSTADGRRFLDNQSLDGPIPVMISDAVSAVERNMRRAAVIGGVGRSDRYDYPLDVIRELLVNAVMHRDYSAGSRGTQIQVELYPDRLVVKSPGGLYGSVDVTELGTQHVSSSRNAVLAKLLAEVPLPMTNEVVCENRGSGLATVIHALRDAGMRPPSFDVGPARVIVTVPQHALLDPATVDWIRSLGVPDLSSAQHLALAMTRSNGRVSNEMLRAWGVERHSATEALTDLVNRGLAVKHGGRRYAQYERDPSIAAVAQRMLEELFDEPAGRTVPSTEIAGEHLAPELAAVLEAIRAGHVTSKSIQQSLDISYGVAIRRIRALREMGLILETAARHSRAQSYRIP